MGGRVWVGGGDGGIPNSSSGYKFLVAVRLGLVYI